MDKQFYSCLVILFSFQAFAYGQITETFADSNFTENPSWSGDTAAFFINDDQQLQTRNTIANATFYISTENRLAVSAEWNFWIRLAFNTSSANYVDVWVVASEADLSSSSNFGYFIRLGDTNDEICLCRKDENGNLTKIIDGPDGQLNSSNNILNLKLTRDNSHEWMLFYKLSNQASFTNMGKAADSIFTSSAYFGFLVHQSTSGFFGKHYFDDITISDFVADRAPPTVQKANAVHSRQVDVRFSKPLKKESAENLSRYFGSNGLGLPESAIQNASDAALVHLTFDSEFENGKEYSLLIDEVEDLYGNVLKNGMIYFSFYKPQRYDVVITEIFADPNPSAGLPAVKFVELKNRSAHGVELRDYTISEGNSMAKLPSFLLAADSFVIITGSSGATAYQPYGNVLAVSNFPSLPVGGSSIVLRSNEGGVMHAVSYDLRSYKNELKKDGGWSLEMIDIQSPCIGMENWAASKDNKGGTPGTSNSVSGVLSESTSPAVMHAFAPDANTVIVYFNKTMDSASVTKKGYYTFDHGLQANEIRAIAPFFNNAEITLNGGLQAGSVYLLSVKQATDCNGNPMTPKSVRVSTAQTADSLDIVINEILFNPPPMGVDYIEIYNRSEKTVNLRELYIANRNTGDQIAGMQPLSNDNKLLFAGNFLAVSSSADIVKSQFITLNPEAFSNVSSMPSFPNSSGSVILLNKQGAILDEVRYSEKWHFPLIKNPQGVALERLNADAPSVSENFHSASASAGYGTPGYENSQLQKGPELKGEITVTPEIFSPDLDGTDDFLLINYQFPGAGFVANITIFDASGRAVRYLQKNSLAGNRGFFKWDGLDDKSRKLPQGIYIVFSEIFNADGRRFVFKNKVVLARRQ